MRGSDLKELCPPTPRGPRALACLNRSFAEATETVDYRGRPRCGRCADVKRAGGDACRTFYSSSIGILIPLARAVSTASPYPASTWRATPMPGSFVSTRLIRKAIPGVPSATVT